MKRLIRSGVLAVVLACAAGCPQTGTPTCTPQSCAAGCCSAAGVCETAGTAQACGLNGAACATSCAACTNGMCIMPSSDAGTADAGQVDAGPNCAVLGDAVLGTLGIVNGQIRVQASSSLPAGVVAVASVQGTLYGLTSNNEVRALGSFPSLTLGARVGSVVPAGVDAGSGFFLGGYLASTDTHLLAGFTQQGAGFPGQVAVMTVADGGVQFVNAPGNYSAVGIGGAANAFLINGTGLGATTGLGVYALRVQSPLLTAQLASFAPDAGLDVGASGAMAITSSGVALVGYSRNPDFTTVVRAVPSSTYLAPLALGTQVSLAGTPVVAEGDVADVTSFGADAVVVRGGYDADFNPFTSAVQRVPLTVSGSGVSVGTPADVLREDGTRCTRVLFVSGAATSLLVGVQDGKGRRLLQFIP